MTALGPTASISPSATAVMAGNSVTLDSAGSSAPAGRTLTGYQWSLTSGSGIAAFSGGTTGATATVVTSGAGGSTGGGGGAVSALWLLALLAAAGVARRPAPVRSQTPGAATAAG